jgi:hypothetical protein
MYVQVLFYGVAHYEKFLVQHLSTFEAGSKRQAEKKKCATVARSPWFVRVLHEFSRLVNAARAETRINNYANEKEEAHLDEKYCVLQDQYDALETQYKEFLIAHDKAHDIIQEYQLKHIGVVPRYEYRKLEQENQALLAELKGLNEKCWNFDAVVAKECHRLGLNQKPGRKKLEKNKTNYDPFKATPEVARSPENPFHPRSPMKVSDSSADRSPTASPAHKRPKGVQADEL